MKKSDFLFAVLVLIAAMLAVVGFMACSNGSTSSPNTTGAVTTFISDPPTCEAPNGPYTSVWVTISKVEAHISGNANPSASGWVNLIPALEANPKQIDLLNLSNPNSTTCILNQLGSASGLPPGRYQQIRLHLLPNDASPGPAPNACAPVGNNCVVMNGTAYALLLSSQDETGIKIPPGQIAGGAINLQAGQPADLNIEFNACSSVIMQSGQRFRLKPTLHAGEFSGASLNSNENAISGKVVQGTTGATPGEPIVGAIVLLEQADADGIDRVVRSGLTGSGGQYIFCPLSDGGSYDVVVAASTFDGSATTTYNATVAFDVPVGTALGEIPLAPEGPTNTSTMPATITGEVTTDASGMAVAVSALQVATATATSTTRKVTVPVFGALSQPPNVTTATDTCPGTASACATYSLQVPASNPSAGAFVNNSISYDAPAGGAVTFNVNGVASGCTGSTLTSPILIPVDVTANTTTDVTTPMVFTGCTPP